MRGPDEGGRASANTSAAPSMPLGKCWTFASTMSIRRIDLRQCVGYRIGQLFQLAINPLPNSAGIADQVPEPWGARLEIMLRELGGIYLASNRYRDHCTPVDHLRAVPSLATSKRSQALLIDYPGGPLRGDVSPSSQSCSSANALQAASMRLYRLCAASSVARSASCAQFSAFSRKWSDCFTVSLRGKDI